MNRRRCSLFGARKPSATGQATVELILALFLFFGIFLFYVQLAFVFAYANVVHYATFMSARAYLSASQSSEEQRERAKDVIVDLLTRGQGSSGSPRFPFIAQGFKGSDPPGFSIVTGGMGEAYRTGVVYEFVSRLPLIPLGGKSSSGAALNTIHLTSESWLGRDPSEEECYRFMQGLYVDNGC
jgi:hypothetical protein